VIEARFERDYGCTEAEWLGWLPGAVRDQALALQPGGAVVSIDPGVLHLHWHALPPRRIALLCMPRLAVSFAFEHVDAQQRIAFMRYFDLFMQRGGG